MGDHVVQEKVENFWKLESLSNQVGFVDLASFYRDGESVHTANDFSK